MCGTSGAECYNGDCRAVSTQSADSAAASTTVERCVCHAMYSGAQCLERTQLQSFELPLASAAILCAMVFGVWMTRRVRAFLTFADAPSDAFAFPRRWTREDDEVGDESPRVWTRRWHGWVGSWVGPTVKGIPWKSRQHAKENLLISLVCALELVPWIQHTAIVFLPVVPWPPTTSKPIATLLRLSLLYPVWEHTTPSKYDVMAFYGALAFVPSVFLLACVLGIKRFPLFKPQPKRTPSEDVCTIVLRVYSDWLVLPVMIMLLTPLECMLIGYTRQEDEKSTHPTVDRDCFGVVTIAYAISGVVAALVYSVVATVVAVQLNCEPSNPVPTLWSDIRYIRIVTALRLPIAVASDTAVSFLVVLAIILANADVQGTVAFMNANSAALCSCCAVHGYVIIAVSTARCLFLP